MITVQNNFLNQKYFKELQTILTSADTPWHFHDGVNNIKDGHYMMGHCLYKNNIPTSSLYNCFICSLKVIDGSWHGNRERYFITFIHLPVDTDRRAVEVARRSQ